MNASRENKFDFNNLFTFEMANNHQGKLEHGLRIINEVADVVRPYNIRGAIKLQFRDLDTFIHPDHKNSTDNKHIPRFLSTKLSEQEFAQLVNETKRRGFVSMCTPFDESSVDKIERLGIEIVKIGSCSAQDWPLLERITETGKPVICSVGGLTIKEIDKIVSFFQHRGVHFALMHCVAMYPTPNDKFDLNQIEILRNRYPGIPIGFSTHEDPSNTTVIKLAYAKGARLFEKHVGVPTEEIKLNVYSAAPDQVAAWVAAFKDASEICGREGERIIPDKEKSDLDSLKRGVYVKKDIKAGETIKKDDVFFAIPLQDGQFLSEQWSDGLVANRDYRAHEPLSAVIYPKSKTKKEIIYSTIHTIKGMLNNARIPLGHDFSVELSHHYGLEQFHETGCVIIECVSHPNYAKKLIVQVAGQQNPTHYHKKKDETFQVLWGTLEADVEGRKKLLQPGDTLWVPPGVWHSFRTDTGVIFEEVSTALVSNDSYYIDKTIAKISRDDRKTYLYNWGRHQFDEIGEN